MVSIVLIVALFVKKDFEVKRTVEIERNVTDVFDYIRYLENHEQFTVWSQLDPTMTKTYSGPDGHVGGLYKWNSTLEEVGAGEQEIVELKENDRLVFDLRFKKPWESEAIATMQLEETSSTSTKIDWSVRGETPWPWNITLLFMDMDGELGPDLEKGLLNLKNTLEVEE